MYDEELAMWGVGLLAVIAIIFFSVMAANTDYCTAVEPDGDRETIVCPYDWQPNEVRQVSEDEYEDYETDD